ncbi:peptide chain release factor 1 [Gammaproteobacteria bacterium]|nr:peptide chain release factor 1 [Gammaproteobacteria bacterium]
MNQELREKLESNISSYKDITNQLSTPEVYTDRVLMKSLNQKLTKLEPGVKLFQKYLNIENSITDTQELLEDDDKEIRNIAQEELKNYKQELKEIENKIIEVTVEKDPNDSRDIYMEIRAGTGGEEAAIFAGDLYKMYSKFSEKNKWDIEIINSNISDHGGFKEVIFKIIGTNVYSNLKFESGTHRVQRVPNTETQGRVHTSASTVAVLPIVEKVEVIDINPADLRIDTYRASGAGGQHVNKTDSAVRVTHIPTGIVSECQDDRSQHKNKAKAMEYLHSRLLSAKQEKQKKDTDESRKKQVGSGDRSERIRTYNFPQGRVTDHRINLTLYKLEQLIEGDIEPLIEALTEESRK